MIVPLSSLPCWMAGAATAGGALSRRAWAVELGPQRVAFGHDLDLGVAELDGLFSGVGAQFAAQALAVESSGVALSAGRRSAASFQIASRAG